MAKYAIGLDYGSLSVRTLLIDIHTGEELATSIYDYDHQVMETELPCGVKLGESWALQHPQDYLNGLYATIREVITISQVNPKDIVAVSYTHLDVYKRQDLGADFRLTDPKDYEEWYQLSYQKPELHELSAYIIPELHRKLADNIKIIANPGCYPTSISLGLAPIIQTGKVDCNSIIIDSKSGVTGAGRGSVSYTHLFSRFFRANLYGYENDGT